MIYNFIVLVFVILLNDYNRFVDSSTYLKKAIGFDFGTSGVRCIGVDSENNIFHEDSIKWTSSEFSKLNLDEMWKRGLHFLLSKLPAKDSLLIDRICVSGTSASALIYDIKQKHVSRAPRMYNYNVYKDCKDLNTQIKVKDILKRYCPSTNPANSPTSTLPKLLQWHFESPLATTEYLCHQVYIS
jgi:sugar (pentulose or hexulose) kinase